MSDAIYVGTLPRAVANAHRIMGGSRRQREQPAEKKYLKADGTPMKRPGIQGWACLFDQAFAHEGRIVYLKNGCLNASIESPQRVRMLFDHKAEREVASTTGGLQLERTPVGLAFRLDLNNSERAHEIFSTVDSGGRACVSVGISFEDYETKEIQGNKVDVVARAKLHEVSLVKAGAIERTFAEVVDLADCGPYLWIDCRQPAFARAQATSNALARVRKITDMLRAS